MTPDEQQLLNSVYKGIDAEFDKKTKIGVQFLRDRILEISRDDADSSPVQPCLRWSIHNAVFEEKLDLQDGRRRGGPLPALEFHECEFHAGFSADGAHIERLLFDRCRFLSDSPSANYITLRNAHVNTEFRVTGLLPYDKPAEDPPVRRLLWIDAFAITVGTNIVVQDTVLRAPEGQSSAALPEPRYALDLSTATIHCDVQLQPNVRFEGGFKMRDAHVGGTVWAQGLHATDGETHDSRSRILARQEQTRSAFRLEGSHVEGRVALGALIGQLGESLNQPDPNRFWCEGKVDLNWVRIDGSLELSGAFVGFAPDASLNLVSSKLGELFARPVIPPVKPQELRFKFTLEVGSFRLDACRIAGNCDIEFAEESPTEVWAEGLSVSGNLTLKGATSRLEAAGLEVSGDTLLVLTNLERCNLGGAVLKGKVDLSDVLFRAQTRRAVSKQSGAGPGADWRLEKAARSSLICYPGFHLTRLTFSSPASKLLWETAFIHGNAHAEPLTGDATQIYALNHALTLNISSEAAAEEYLKFFCAYVWGRYGPFVVIEDLASLPAAFRDRIPPEELVVKKGPSGGPDSPLAFDCLVRHKRELHRASFVIGLDGEVTMPSSARVTIDGVPVGYSRAEVPGYRKPFRFASAPALLSVPDFRPANQPSSEEDSLRQFLADVPDWRLHFARSTHKVAPTGTVLSLRDADIGRMLVASPLFQIESAKRWSLRCYPGFVLYEVVLRADGSYSPYRSASFLSNGKTSRVLSGDSQVFHQINKEGRLQISYPAAAIEYLRLFTSYTWANSAFPLIESDSSLPQAFRGKLSVRPVTLNTGKSDLGAGRYIFDAYVRYGFYLYKAEFVVGGDGTVSMEGDENVIFEGRPVVYPFDEVTDYRKPFRLLTASGTFSDFSSDTETQIDPSEFRRRIPDWNERLMAGRLGGVRVDLRDASCATLNDNAGLVWRDAATTELEEFTYQSLFLPPNADVDDERQARLRWLSGSAAGDEQSFRARSRRVLAVFGIGPTRDQRPFRAQPYTQLAKAFRQRGDDEAARDVEKEKLRLAAYYRASSPMGRLAMIWWWFYGVGFRFGLSPMRAFFTVLVFWTIGFKGIQLLDQNDLLKTNVSTFAAAAIVQPKGDIVPYLQHASSPPPNLPCGDSIDPKLYAAELLVPILNLHQANRCDIREERPQDAARTTLKFAGRDARVPHFLVLPRTWEYVRAIYMLLGSVVTSVALLTFSGIARRWEH